MRKLLTKAVLAVSVISLLPACAGQGTMPNAPSGGETVMTAENLRPVAARAELNRSYDEAAKIYASLLERDPGNSDYFLGLARNLRYAGKTQAAIDLLTRPDAPKDNPILLLELGKCYLAADQLNLARPALEKAKVAAPLNWDIPSTLGVVLDYMDQNDLAQAEYAAALQLSPDNPTVLNNLALSLAQSGKLDEAIATMQRAVDQQSAQAQSRQNLALLMALKGRPEDAERLIRKDLPPDMAENNINYYRSFQIVPSP